MPLDRIQARKLVNAAEAGYSRGPHAEFIGLIAGQLKDALDIVDLAGAETQRAQNETSTLQRQLDEEKTHYRKLREQSAHTEAAVAVLREISKNPKGAKAKAADMLKLMKVEEEPAAEPEKIEVP